MPVVRVDASVQCEKGITTVLQNVEDNKGTYGFIFGAVFTIVLFIIFIGLNNRDMRREGTGLLGTDTGIRILMTESSRAHLFATDAGYILYDGERLYVEMDRCNKPVDAKKEQ